MKALWISILIFFSSLLHAEEKKDLTVIRASQLLDVKTGKLTSNPVLIIQGAEILSINRKEIPQEATLIDLSGMSLLPGLIDVHTHLTYDANNHR
jgi:imidazolonepropionase-like amidohydrolase